MNFKGQTNLRYLLLMPALILGQEFLPLWYIVLYTVILLYITFLKPIKWLPYLNFISVYYIFATVGRIVVPETMVPMLGVFLISRFLMNKRENEFEMYPIFLWIGAFAIFSSSFYYLVYTLFSILIIFLYENSERKLSISAILQSIFQHKKQLLMSIFITVLLFIFFPRFHNFLPTTNLNTQGKIGYSKNINNSQTANLLLSSQTAFFAELSTKVAPELLYWRGRVHSKTDGYNWTRIQMHPKRLKINISKPKIIQTIKYEQDFNGDIILLDSPLKVLDTNLSIYRVPITNEFKSYVKKKKAIVTAESSLNVEFKSPLKKSNRKKYLQLPGFTPQELKSFLQDIKGSSATEIIESFRQKIVNDKFSYTLNPGPMPTMSDFLKKKQGYCTHFSSLLGIVLRKRNIPSRLISGFQGGKYNSVGNFYEIKSNDAHAWVEFYANGYWQKVDPTSFVSPDRIRLGGQTFLNPGAINTANNKQSKILQYFNTARLYFDNLNYKVSLFLDNYDRTKQNELSKTLKMGLKGFFLMGFILTVLSFAFYYLWQRSKKKLDLHPADKLLLALDKKLKKQQIKLHEINTIKEMKQIIKGHPAQTELLEFLNLYQESRYGRKDNNEQLKDILKKI